MSTSKTKFISPTTYVRPASDTQRCVACNGKKGTIINRFGYWLHNKCAPHFLRTADLSKVIKS